MREVASGAWIGGLAVLAVLAVPALAGCGAAPGDEVVTAAERQQFMRAAETQQLRRELRPARCGASSEMAQVRARSSDYRGADAFDSRGCPRGSVADPTIPPPPR